MFPAGSCDGNKSKRVKYRASASEAESKAGEETVSEEGKVKRKGSFTGFLIIPGFFYPMGPYDYYNLRVCWTIDSLKLPFVPEPSGP